MGAYVYCIAPSGHHPPRRLHGIDGALVQPFEVGGLTAWQSPLDRSPEPTIERIRAHDRVIRAADSAPVTPLPVRFGQWFRDGTALADRITASAGAYADALARVAGCVEFGLTLVVDGPVPEKATAAAPPAAAAVGARAGSATAEASEPDERPGGGSDARGPGRRYLHELASRRQHQRDRGEAALPLLTTLGDRLDFVVRDERVAPPGRRDAAVRVAHLVRRSDAERYAAVVNEFRRDLTGPGLKLTGPWPPYSFAP